MKFEAKHFYLLVVTLLFALNIQILSANKADIVGKITDHSTEKHFHLPIFRLLEQV